MASRRPQSARRLPPEGPAWPREGTEKAIEGLKMAALKRTDYIHNPRRGSTACRTDCCTSAFCDSVPTHSTEPSSACHRRDKICCRHIQTYCMI